MADKPNCKNMPWKLHSPFGLFAAVHEMIQAVGSVTRVPAVGNDTVGTLPAALAQLHEAARLPKHHLQSP